MGLTPYICVDRAESGVYGDLHGDSDSRSLESSGYNGSYNSESSSMLLRRVQNAHTYVLRIHQADDGLHSDQEPLNIFPPSGGTEDEQGGEEAGGGEGRGDEEEGGDR